MRSVSRRRHGLVFPSANGILRDTLDGAVVRRSGVHLHVLLALPGRADGDFRLGARRAVRRARRLSDWRARGGVARHRHRVDAVVAGHEGLGVRGMRGKGSTRVTTGCGERGVALAWPGSGWLGSGWVGSDRFVCYVGLCACESAEVHKCFPTRPFIIGAGSRKR